MSDTTPTVLFVCVHNAGRSQMAAAWLERLAGGRVRVLSGGSLPAAAVNPAAVAAMAEVGLDISARTPQPWTGAAVREADVVITMGCGDTCPFFPGKRYEDWEVADPAGRPLEEVREVRNDIEQRVRGLMESLGLDPA
jgi:protein-tyrosine-phosphatase